VSTDVQLSRHAAQRKAEMALTDEETAAVALDPELVYPADSRQGPDRKIHQRGRLCSVHGPDGTVITFMWSGRETGYRPWTR
jgi:hypothetical protein